MVVGLIECNGKVLLKYVPRADAANMVSFSKKHVPKDSTVYTDESTVYHEIKRSYNHGSVKHSVSIYVDGEVHTNTIENFWSILKRRIYGIYHQVRDKHISRYLDEFAARFNTRTLSPQERFDGFLESWESVLGYKKLIS